MLESLDTLAPLAAPLAVVLGLVIGSFLNVVIYRTPVMMERGWTQLAREHLQLDLTEEERQPFNLLKPDSRCLKCHAPVRAWQNILVVSYLMLSGKCGSCKTPISIRCPSVELLTGILFAVVVWQYGWSWAALGDLILTAVLATLTLTDTDMQYLSDQFTLPLIWLGLLLNFGGVFVSLQPAVLGTVCGYISLWLLSSSYRLVHGVQGMGAGDFKLLAASGAWSGVGTPPALVLMSILVDLADALIMRAVRSQPFVFGSSLAIAGWVVFTTNEPVSQLIRWWLTESGF